jgi:ATPase subunit of ABC transporter with duplicated ATPase domains
MDYVAKQQFIDWMKSAREAMLVITHDRDVLKEVDRIVELKDGGSVSYRGNYDAYLKQNAARTSTGMSDFEMVEKRIVNLKQKVIDYKRLQEKSRNPQTIQKFIRLENTSREELVKLQEIEKPTFWIDKESAAGLDFKSAGRYQKFKTKNIRMNLKSDESRSKHQLVTARDLSLGYDTPLFSGISIDLRESEAVELRGRNGAGKSTLIKKLLLKSPVSPSSSSKAADISEDDGKKANGITVFTGELTLDPDVRVGVYEQEVSPTLFDFTLHDAIEKIYLDRKLAISETKISQLMSDYLFSEGDGQVPVGKLSGGQKARLQIIDMLSNNPKLLVLDEPTNHLDLPSIEELETALEKYSGAILYVSHDGYFRDAIGGNVITIAN